MSTSKCFLDPCEHPLLGEAIGSGILHLFLVEYFQGCIGYICARIWLTSSFKFFFLLIRERHLFILLLVLLFEAIVHLRVLLLYGGCGVCTEVAHYALPHGGPPAGPSSLLLLVS